MFIPKTPNFEIHSPHYGHCFDRISACSISLRWKNGEGIIQQIPLGTPMKVSYHKLAIATRLLPKACFRYSAAF